MFGSSIRSAASHDLPAYSSLSFAVIAGQSSSSLGRADGTYRNRRRVPDKLSTVHFGRHCSFRLLNRACYIELSPFFFGEARAVVILPSKAFVNDLIIALRRDGSDSHGSPCWLGLPSFSTVPANKMS